MDKQFSRRPFLKGSAVTLGTVALSDLTGLEKVFASGQSAMIRRESIFDPVDEPYFVPAERLHPKPVKQQRIFRAFPAMVNEAIPYIGKNIGK